MTLINRPYHKFRRKHSKKTYSSVHADFSGYLFNCITVLYVCRYESHRLRMHRRIIQRQMHKLPLQMIRLSGAPGDEAVANDSNTATATDH